MYGWAIDPDSTGPVQVHVYVDYTFAGLTTANGSRGDVAGAYPGWGPGHGFALAVPAGPGTHWVCAYAINVATGTENTGLGCRWVSPQPIGSIDGATSRPGTMRVHRLVDRARHERTRERRLLRERGHGRPGRRLRQPTRRRPRRSRTTGRTTATTSCSPARAGWSARTASRRRRTPRTPGWDAGSWSPRRSARSTARARRPVGCGSGVGRSHPTRPRPGTSTSTSTASCWAASRLQAAGPTSAPRSPGTEPNHGYDVVLPRVHGTVCAYGDRERRSEPAAGLRGRVSRALRAP